MAFKGFYGGSRGSGVRHRVGREGRKRKKKKRPYGGIERKEKMGKNSGGETEQTRNGVGDVC